MYKCVMRPQENMDMLVKNLEIRNISYPCTALLVHTRQGYSIIRAMFMITEHFEAESVPNLK